MTKSPFKLDNENSYQHWRESKISNQPDSVEELIISIKDINNPEPNAISAIKKHLNNCNMAVFATEDPQQVNNESLKAFGEHFGLKRLNHNEGSESDGVTRLSVAEAANWRGTYIPYTSRAINWHTDGYYNNETDQIRGLILYCEQQAEEGGENKLLDHDMAYIHLRDTNPEFITALMQKDVMMIPANDVSDDSIVRPDRYGPVFSVDNMADNLADNKGKLHMRSTARKRNIVWKDTPLVKAAVTELETFLNSDSPWIFKTRLQPGQGLICNNVLHTRTGFTDSKQQTRVFYRLRYYDHTN